MNSFVSRGFRCSTSCSAGFPVLLTCHMPFPSGGNRWGLHIWRFTCIGYIVVLNTRLAGSKSSLSHTRMRRLGYLRCSIVVHVVVPSVPSRVAVCASSLVNCGLRFLFGISLLL